MKIAIDGFSSCGKSTLARDLAAHLGFTYIDSGAMYRAVALFALENGLVKAGELDREGLLAALDKIEIDFRHDPDSGRSATWLNGRNVEPLIRSMEVSDHVTLVSPVPEVRAKLVRIQQQLGQGRSVVMDGRDIGTVVFPDAELKLFMTASPEVRARRRHEELLAKGVEVVFEQVVENIRMRDQDDTTRVADPLLKAPDAIELDNSDITREAQFDLALKAVDRAMAQAGD